MADIKIRMYKLQNGYIYFNFFKTYFRTKSRIVELTSKGCVFLKECLRFLIVTLGLECEDTQLIAQYFAFPHLTDRRPFCALSGFVYFHSHEAGSLRRTVKVDLIEMKPC